MFDQLLEKLIVETEQLKGVAKEYPIAGKEVAGLKVRDFISNQSSIGASLSNWEILDNIREIPMSDLTGITGHGYSKDDNIRIDQLAEEIKISGEIEPLIVVQDREGIYILEGVHRIDALYKLGKKSFPAMLVLDLESLSKK